MFAAPRLPSLVALALSTAWFVTPAAVSASPWTLPQGGLTVTTSTDFQYATDEFLITGEHQAFPLDGRFFSMNVRAGVRYGLTDRTEIGTNLVGSYVGYFSDPVYLGDIIAPDVGDEGSAERFRANIASFNRNAGGIGDLRLYLRQRFTPLRRFVAAGEIVLKLPTGYTDPEGTFDEDDPSRGINDDVALGDGQTDIDAKLLLGWVPVNDWFLRLDAGYRIRTGGPGHQTMGAFKTGYRISDLVLPYVGVEGEYTVFDGDTVGQTFVAIDADVPASEFTGDNVRAEHLRLDRDWIRPSVGMIFALGGRDIDLSYGYVVWGRNVAQTHVFSLGTTFSIF